jgi:hypothetical protein
MEREVKMSGKLFALLTGVGIAWGILGVSFIGPNPRLVFGWIPLSMVSITATGVYAAVINWIYFRNYGGENS